MNKESRTPINVLFICLGNICRSPMAEAVFKDLVAKGGLADRFHITSRGTGDYHEGEPAHPGTRRILAAHGIRSDTIAQQVRRAELDRADYIVAMDRHNVSDLQWLASQGALDGRLSLLLSHTEGGAAVLDVPDPYYTGNFEEVYRLVETACTGLLAHIRRERGL